MDKTDYQFSLHFLVYLSLSEHSVLILDIVIPQWKTNPKNKWQSVTTI